MGRGRPRKMHPNSLANLTPFAPGQCGNPRGRPSAGMSIREWMNQFVANDLTKADLIVIAEDEEQPVAQRVAAQSLLACLEHEWHHAQHLGLKAASTIMDYTDGRPVQRIEVERTQYRPPDEVFAEIRVLLTEDPSLLDLVLKTAPEVHRVIDSSNPTKSGVDSSVDSTDSDEIEK